MTEFRSHTCHGLRAECADITFQLVSVELDYVAAQHASGERILFGQIDDAGTNRLARI